jgi:hypothetical protein
MNDVGERPRAGISLEVMVGAFAEVIESEETLVAGSATTRICL